MKVSDFLRTYRALESFDSRHENSSMSDCMLPFIHVKNQRRRKVKYTAIEEFISYFVCRVLRHLEFSFKLQLYSRIVVEQLLDFFPIVFVYQKCWNIDTASCSIIWRSLPSNEVLYIVTFEF